MQVTRACGGIARGIVRPPLLCLEPSFILPVKQVENGSFSGVDAKTGQSPHGPISAAQAGRPEHRIQ